MGKLTKLYYRLKYRKLLKHMATDDFKRSVQEAKSKHLREE